MKLAALKIAFASLVIGLATGATLSTAEADAATGSARRAALPPTILAPAAADTKTALPAGKWRHPASTPETAERADPSPAYENASSQISGTAFLPVILVDFSDNLAEQTLHTPTAFRDMLFQDGYPHGAGSLRDYYQDQSGGLFDVTGQVSAWLRMPKTYATYVGSNFGMQTTEPSSRTLVKDAVAAADSSMNFCNGDTDADGYVDSLFVVHAGPGAEEGRVSSRLWSIQWTLPTPYTTQDVCANGQRVKISTFTIEPEEYVTTSYSAPGAPARMVAIGIFAHEFGHALGLPDLYDTDRSSNGGVGAWDVMASGSWGYNGAKPWLPTPFSAWSKTKLGWVTPQNVTVNKLGVSIPSADAAHTGVFNGVYRLAVGGSATSKEYFLVENRQPVGWARDFPAGGLAIWHIDDAVGGNANDAHRQVALLPADNLLTRGDAGDLFPGTSLKRAIDGSTTPSTDSYSGVDTGVAIRSIGDAGTSTRADLIVSAAPASDTTPPVMGAITRQFPLGYQISGTQTPVEFRWSATDTGGITAFEVYWSTDNGASWTKDTSAPATATSIVRLLAFNGTYKYAVRARDAAGNWSGYSYSVPVTPKVVNDQSVSGWTRYNLTGTYGGSYVAASAAGSWYQQSFTGREIGLIAPKGSAHGQAKIYCDGVYSALIDTHAESTVVGQVVARCAFTTNAQHTMKVVVEGTATRPWVGVDAFVTFA